MKLGTLIKKMEECKNDKGYVSFDFGGAAPSELDSYRGYYDELALGYDGSYGADMSPKNFYKTLTKAIGKIFTGWKGGEYKMDENTPVHVACPGCTSNTIITDVIIDKSEHQDITWVTLETRTEID